MENINNIPLHMNVMVVFFAILPFFVLLGVYFAKKHKYKLHFISQGFTLIITTLVLLYFEVMIRLDGGFFEFAKQSSMSHEFLVKYLIFHVIIALITAVLWIMLFLKSMILYQSGKIEEIKKSNHKKMGMITFAFLVLSCVTGIFLYLFLFIF